MFISEYKFHITSYIIHIYKYNKMMGNNNKINEIKVQLKFDKSYVQFLTHNKYQLIPISRHSRKSKKQTIHYSFDNYIVTT